MSTIEATLAERGKRYGEFAGHAQITQSIKALFHSHAKWLLLANDQKEALEMIAHKIGRIFNGDPDYDDSWVDIAGYAKLVADRLTATPATTPQSEMGNILVGGKSEGWDFKFAVATTVAAAADKASCSCSACNPKTSLTPGEIDEIGALSPGVNIVIVTVADKDEQT